MSLISEVSLLTRKYGILGNTTSEYTDRDCTGQIRNCKEQIAKRQVQIEICTGQKSNCQEHIAE